VNRTLSEILIGIACLAVGFVLWATTQEIVTPVFELRKIGVVLMFVGGGGILWALVTAGRSPRGRSRR
jgi:hypothetical protein